MRTLSRRPPPLDSTSPRLRARVMRLLHHLADLDDLGLGGGGLCTDRTSSLRDDLLLTRLTLRRLLPTLSPQDQEVVSQLSHATHEQVAHQLGVTLTTLRGRLFRIAGRLLRGGLFL